MPLPTTGSSHDDVLAQTRVALAAGGIVHRVYGSGGPLIVYATSASLLPALGLALVVGERLHHRVPEAPFRVLVYALLLVAAVSLLWRALDEVSA